MVTTTFGKLPKGAFFECNGNLWVKTSSATAKMRFGTRRFYFGLNEVVKGGA